MADAVQIASDEPSRSTPTASVSSPVKLKKSLLIQQVPPSKAFLAILLTSQSRVLFSRGECWGTGTRLGRPQVKNSVK